MDSIFISHATQDNDFVRSLVQRLEACRCSVWVDYSHIRGGSGLPSSIGDAILNNSALLLIWSAAAARSYWVRLEWETALSIEKKVIPCLLDLTELPTLLKSRSHIDLRDLNEGFPNLASALDLNLSSDLPTTDSWDRLCEATRVRAHVLNEVSPRSVQLTWKVDHSKATFADPRAHLHLTCTRQDEMPLLVCADLQSNPAVVGNLDAACWNKRMPHSEKPLDGNLVDWEGYPQEWKLVGSDIWRNTKVFVSYETSRLAVDWLSRLYSYLTCLNSVFEEIIRNQTLEQKAKALPKLCEGATSLWYLTTWSRPYLGLELTCFEPSAGYPSDVGAVVIPIQELTEKDPTAIVERLTADGTLSAWCKATDVEFPLKPDYWEEH